MRECRRGRLEHAGSCIAPRGGRKGLSGPPVATGGLVARHPVPRRATPGILPAMGSARSGALRGGRGSLVAWLPAVAWAGLIFMLSAQPGLRFAPDDAMDLVLRKTGHMAVFGILALLLWSAVAATTTRRRPWAWALALTLAYAAFDELHQGSVPMRHASWVDVGNRHGRGAARPRGPRVRPVASQADLTGPARQRPGRRLLAGSADHRRDVRRRILRSRSSDQRSM